MVEKSIYSKGKLNASFGDRTFFEQGFLIIKYLQFKDVLRSNKNV